MTVRTLLMLVGISFLMTTSCTNNDPLAPGLIGLTGHWTFDEGIGTVVKDESGAVGDGVLNDEAGWAAPGYRGSAFNGTGATHIQIEDDQLSVTFPGKLGGTPLSFSIMAWINQTQAGYQMILAKDEQGQRSFNFGINLLGQLSAQVYPAGWTVGSDFVNAVGDSILSPNQGWAHVAMVYAGIAPGEYSVSFYIGGELDEEATFQAGPIAATPTAVRIGARNFSPQVQSNFIGMIDELRVYNRALAASEIKTYMDL